ncbi:hypothetical protein PENPOL_c023G02585 [Penicillium polonicum]|uniref:Uncharacterized protein n=1 Tax=Penicillium polonicum TaxID=60169 RepID=A0A1V6N753_PENPO|nr:hypothetical protein PENPOL_c023G02585 [Penicillium polonicum]
MAEFLPGLEGAEVTLNSPPEPPFYFASETWQIVEKLDECPYASTKEDIADVFGPGYVAGNFLCRPAGSDAQEKVAFMRIYKQIPTAGTEFQKFTIRAAQAAGPCEHTELIALKAFMEKGCDVVLKLLGYRLGKQDEDDIVPGGYITYVVWEKVRGDSLDGDMFWSCPFSQRQEIRAKFRQVYEKLLQFGCRPGLPAPSKIIYDWATGEMHISGFGRVIHVDTSTKWDNRIYAGYGLGLKSMEMDHLYPVRSTDVYRDDKGWRW